MYCLSLIVLHLPKETEIYSPVEDIYSGNHSLFHSIPYYYFFSVGIVVIQVMHIHLKYNTKYEFRYSVVLQMKYNPYKQSNSYSLPLSNTETNSFIMCINSKFILTNVSRITNPHHKTALLFYNCTLK